MSNKRYTVTVYAAAPGTPLFNHQTGLPKIDKETNKQKTSLPGHMFYAISTDGGRTQTAYGFAPVKDSERVAWYSLDMPGEMQKEEHKIYRNPYYARTMEITEQQYQILKEFGDSPEQYGFNRNTYNLATNSCIDFTFKALKESGIYKGRPVDYHKEGVKIGTVTVYEKAALRVLENIPVLEKMPDQMNSPLNRTVRGQMPDRTLLQWLTTENRQQDLNPGQPQYAHMQNGQPGIQTAPAADKFDLLAQTNHLIAQLQAGNPRALAEFTAQPEIQAAAQEARAEAQMLLRQNPHLADGLLPNRFNRPEFSDMPPQVQKLYAEGKEKLQGYYQEHGIRYGEEALENTAMALAAEGYRNRMRSVTMIVLKDGQVHIGDDTAPDFRRASVDAKEAGLTAGHESMARAQETEQEFARQAQQREMERMAESRSRGMSIG